MAPPKMNGTTTGAWLARAYVFSAPVMVASHTKGEFTFTLPRMTQLLSTTSAPNTMRVISIESAARDGAVTEPMNGLSPYLMWLYTMSRWRLLTGTSTGSHTVPPEWCNHGLAYDSFTKFSKSARVA